MLRPTCNRQPASMTSAERDSSYWFALSAETLMFIIGQSFFFFLSFYFPHTVGGGGLEFPGTLVEMMNYQYPGGFLLCQIGQLFALSPSSLQLARLCTLPPSK